MILSSYRPFIFSLLLLLSGCNGAPQTKSDKDTPPGTDEDAGASVASDFNRDWRFVRDFSGADPVALALDDAGWENVTLPHSARVEALVTGAPGSSSYQWQGECWYRKRFTLAPETDGKKVFLMFEGAMNVADVWLDGVHLGQHLGGYLPFGFDISGSVPAGVSHTLAVRLDNSDNPLTGPKPLSELDFNLYGGIYREVRLIVKDPLHITEPILADKPASGGVFFSTLTASAASAETRVQAHVKNDDTAARTFGVRWSLTNSAGETAALASSVPLTLQPGADTEVVQMLSVSTPLLWSPRAPNLYTLLTEVMSGATVVDSQTTTVGIRRIAISTEGFFINGEKMYLQGVNRHQEYPYIGYALSNAAQYRDARKIKDAGFDYVRLSHYPHDPAFMDACDKLGIAVMDAIPGWQYFGDDPAFSEVQYDNSRRMIRRDRNHPSVIAWEVSLNETDMPVDFISKMHAIAHEEYPGDQCYTSGWKEGYDVLIEARQHGGCTTTSDIPCVVSEYGDWEYYAQNAGLEQDGWADLAPEEANSRQQRWQGERALLQQATNFQEAHNDNLSTIAFADGLWVMYDYNRGYAPDIESSGCMDIMRLPKFSHYLFQSQRDPGESYRLLDAGPMVFIASYWTEASDLQVRVFSNGDEVALYLNGALVERRGPDSDRMSTHLTHPPFTFQLSAFEPGTLEAVAYRAGAEVARHVVRTPGAAAALTLWFDESGRPFAAEGKDTVFVHGALIDENGTVVPDAFENVFFGATGDATLIGANPFSTDAGIASILIQSDTENPRAAVYALAIVQEGDTLRVLSAGAPLDGAVSAYEIHITTDGGAPTKDSPIYAVPVSANQARAVLIVDGNEVAWADSPSDKLRIQGSTASP